MSIDRNFIELIYDEIFGYDPNITFDLRKSEFFKMIVEEIEKKGEL